MKRNSKVKTQKSKVINNLTIQQFNNSGFTLIELLVVMVVVVTVGAIIASILFSALRGSNKSKAINNLENNGNYVMSQISKMVRFSKKFDGVSVTGATYSANCSQVIPAAPTPTPTPVEYKYLKITSYDGGQTIFSCDGTTISSNSASMLDTATVSLASCTFICSQTSPSDYPIISIKFTLTQYTPTAGASFLPEQTASANFQTSITPRNLNR
jgi:prepilin-type N-terminal cleavage/methylation domain-containing protein